VGLLLSVEAVERLRLKVIHIPVLAGFCIDLIQMAASMNLIPLVVLRVVLVVEVLEVRILERRRLPVLESLILVAVAVEDTLMETCRHD
jgi:hypothetical protein